MTILFDLDGTLIDSTEAILESFGVAYKNMNDNKPDDNEIKNLVGYPLDIMFARLGVKEELVWDYVGEYKKYYRTVSKIKTELLPNAIEAITLASSFASVGVVTTKTGLFSKELLENWNILHHFAVVIGREDVENPKPHKEPIEKALNVLNKSKENAWIIGDTILDAQSAINAGIKCAGVTCGYGKEDDLLKVCSIVKPNSLEAIKYIKEINKR